MGLNRATHSTNRNQEMEHGKRKTDPEDGKLESGKRTLEGG
jgi:hypothetical protein